MATLKVKDKWTDVFRIPHHTLVDRENINFDHEDFPVDAAKKAVNKNRSENLNFDGEDHHMENKNGDMFSGILRKLGERLKQLVEKI
jgi:hypothetical protein